MKLYILFGQRPEEYAGQYAPEALVCWDQFCIEENPDGFDEDCKKALERCGKDAFAATKVIKVEVDGDEITRLLIGAPTIEGTIVS